MGFLRDQASRLIRTKWGHPSVDLAMEELFAIFTGDEPIVFDSPVTITNNSNAPPLTIRDFGSSDSTISITKAPLPRPLLDELPPLDFGDIGGITFTDLYPDGTAETWSGDRGDPPTPTPGTGTNPNTGGGGGFPGVVVSGTGASYTVAVYEDGLSSPPTNRAVTQLSIAVSETIPAGTWWTIGKVGNDYFMQVPVWS